MKVLVTGASGFLGYHTCRYFVDKGFEVLGVDVVDFDYPDLNDRITFYKGSITDVLLVNKITKGVDIIIHGAAALPLWSKKQIHDTNVNGTFNLLQSTKTNAVSRMIYISSTAVYGIPKTHPVDENYPLNGVGGYGESKIEAERYCLMFRDLGLCIPIIRPKTFAGSMRMGVFQVLCDWVRDKRNIPIVGNGENKYQLLHIDDLLDAIYLVCTMPDDLVNDTFNVGAIEYQTMKQDLQALLDYAGFGKKVIAIPSWFVIPVLKILERVHLSPLYEWVYETADKDHYVSADKIKNKLGWQPKKSTADVWIDTYKWYVEEYADKKVMTGKSHRVAWEQGILKLAKVFF